MNQGLLTNNLRLKLLALVCSVALWFFVAGQSNTEVRFLVPLGIKGTPKNMVMTGAPPGTIEVRVTGPKLVIHNLSPTQIMAEVDLSGAEEGTSTLKLRKSDVTAPAGVEVIGLRPDAVEVRLDRMIKVVVPIRARVKGSPAAGFRFAGASVSPDVVEVSGLKDQVDAVKYVSTTPVDVTGLRESRTFQARVDIMELDVASLSVDRINVRVNIEGSPEKQ